jgi:hypothetical protein
VDVDLCSGNETTRLLAPDAPTNSKVPVADDAGDVGATSAEANPAVAIVPDAP